METTWSQIVLDLPDLGKTGDAWSESGTDLEGQVASSNGIKGIQKIAAPSTWEEALKQWFAKRVYLGQDTTKAVSIRLTILR